ncbi:MAG: DNA primase, partial [Halieaceae bacterium]
MARIPEKFIDDLLDRVDIVEVIDRRVKLRKSGKNFSACCPFHDEKTPSFSVNPEKQFYYCFGCGAGGNAIGFVMDYERMEFPEAVESLAQTCGLEVPREEVKPGEKPAQDSNRPLLEQLEQAARFYEHGLRRHEQASRAVTYLKGRGLTGEIAKQFRIGFAPPGWDNLLTTLGTQDSQQKLLMTGGMLVKNDKDRVYDRFRDRIMFPILDARGRVIAFGGRVLGDDKPKYLNSPETPVFQKSRELYGLYQARKAERSLDRIVVVEGYMDVIALAQFGITYAVATLGTATSEAHLERLFRHVPEVVFCFDGDEAGRRAAFRALESTLPAMEDGRQARFLFLPEGEDPDTVVRDKGREHLEHLFDTATPLETFLFDQLAQGIDTSTLDGKARFSKMAAPFLHQLPEGVFKTLMYQDLAERTGIDIDSLKRLQTPPPEVVESLAAHRSDPSQTVAEGNMSLSQQGRNMEPEEFTVEEPPAWLNNEMSRPQGDGEPIDDSL